MGKKTLGLKLLELRQQHNLTQKQLCESLNLGRSTYSYFETGSRTPDIDTLLLIARYYNITIEDVMELSKADFNFLMDYKRLTEENKAELQYIMNYKLRKQTS